MVRIVLDFKLTALSITYFLKMSMEKENPILLSRPERLMFYEKFEKTIPEFRLRTKVKAGLTGYAQIYGKYNTTPLDKLRMDLMYIENYSFLTDVVLKTVQILFKKESTEGVAEKNSILKKDDDSIDSQNEKEVIYK